MDPLEEIDETTVGRLDGVRVGVANIWPRTYYLSDGSAREGLTAQLFLLLEDQNPGIVVGQGSIVAIGSSQWEVVSVTREPGKRGTIALRKLAR